MERLENNFFDETDPRSFINLVPVKLKELIKVVPDEFWNMTESEIIKQIWGKQVSTAPPEWSKVRLALWRQYDIKVKNQYVSQIKVTDFLKGIFDSPRFYSELEKNPAKTRYLSMEAMENWVKHEDVLSLGIDEMRKIMLMEPAVNARTGVPAYELFKLKFEIFRFLEERQNPQKKVVQNENLNVNVKATPADLSRFRNMAEIDAEIARLEAESKPALMSAKPYIEPLMQMKPIEAERVLIKSEKASEEE